MTQPGAPHSTSKRRFAATGLVLASSLVGTACATAEDGTEQSTTIPSTTGTSVATTAAFSTTTSTQPGPTTTEVTTVDSDVIVSWIQEWLNDEYARSEPAQGVTGASRLECLDPGPIEVGGVIACVGRPQTEPGFQLDSTGVAIYVLDDSGTAAWETGTDLPDTTARLLEAYEGAPKGLFCRDLLSPSISAYPFSGSGRPAESAHFWSLVYWSLESEPARMDEDGNGIPCESLYYENVVTEVLRGGPVPLYLRG